MIARLLMGLAAIAVALTGIVTVHRLFGPMHRDRGLKARRWGWWFLMILLIAGGCEPQPEHPELAAQVVALQKRNADLQDVLRGTALATRDVVLTCEAIHRENVFLVALGIGQLRGMFAPSSPDWSDPFATEAEAAEP